MASHETQPVGDDPVFVDGTGRRRRRLVLCGRLGVAALAAATAVTVVGLAGGARLPSLALPAPLTPAAPRTTHPTTREAPSPASRIPEREAVTVSTPVLETAAVRSAKARTTAVTSAPSSRPAVVPSPSAADTGTPKPSAATGRKRKACTAGGRKPPRAAAACRARSGHKK